MTTFFHITLDLPVQFDIGGDVQVQGEVQQVTQTVVVHGVQTLKDNDRSRFNCFRSVKCTIDVVVDGFFHSLPLLEGLDLFVHEIKVVLKWVQGGETGHLTSITVIKMVIIKTDHGGKVGHRSVGFPPTRGAESTSQGTNDIPTNDIPTQNVRQTASPTRWPSMPKFDLEIQIPNQDSLLY